MFVTIKRRATETLSCRSYSEFRALSDDHLPAPRALKFTLVSGRKRDTTILVLGNTRQYKAVQGGNKDETRRSYLEFRSFEFAPSIAAKMKNVKNIIEPD